MHPASCYRSILAMLHQDVSFRVAVIQLSLFLSSALSSNSSLPSYGGIAPSLSHPSIPQSSGLSWRNISIAFSNSTVVPSSIYASGSKDPAFANGQNCFAYTGNCVHLDDKEAMQKACGIGNTVVGWDDAGCGSGSCVSVLIFLA